MQKREKEQKAKKKKKKKTSVKVETEKDRGIKFRWKRASVNGFLSDTNRLRLIDKTFYPIPLSLLTRLKKGRQSGGREEQGEAGEAGEWVRKD